MEYRKIIRFGNSSHVVSMPRQWIKKHNLKKGDVVYIDENSSSITLYPRESSEIKKVKTQIIDVEDLSEEIIKRKIIGAYINNMDIITVSGSNLLNKTREIKKVIEELMALEIVEQSKDKIILKSFLKIEDVNIQNIIRKADHNLNSMFQDLEDLYQTNTLEAIELSDGISDRDSQVNKMCFLLFRIINNSLENGHHQAQEMLKYWGLAFFMEEVADELKRLARTLSTMGKPTCMKIYFKIISKAKDNYKKAMTGFYSGNKDLIYQVANQRNDLLQECEDLLERCKDNPKMVNLIDNTKHFIAKIHNLNRVSY